MKTSKYAFTLAEALMTLTLIGIVAMLTIPPMSQRVNQYTIEKQQRVFAAKFAEGLKVMQADNKLAQAYTTAEFVEEMKNYFGIAKICDPEHLTSCFSANIYGADDEEHDVSKLKNIKNFNVNYSSSQVWGLQFADGTDMLISYIPNCMGPEHIDMSSSPQMCLLYLYDVNAQKAPNSYSGNTETDTEKTSAELSEMKKGKDIIGNISFEEANLFDLTFTITGMAKSKTHDEAVDFCRDKGGLADKTALKEIAEKIYIESGACPSITSITYAQKVTFSGCDIPKLKGDQDSIWNYFSDGKNSRKYIWSSESGKKADNYYFWYYDVGEMGYNGYGPNNRSYIALCVRK